LIYKVRARFKAATAADFLEKLTDGTIQNQRPDGAEMVRSMNRAVVAADGSIEWSEKCFCGTPLAHERATVLDTYFEDLSTDLIDDYRDYAGEPFMGYLEQLAGSPSRRNGAR
jgi:hypothetical protein